MINQSSSPRQLRHAAENLLVRMRDLADDLATHEPTVLSAKLTRSLLCEAGILSGVAAAMLQARDEGRT